MKKFQALIIFFLLPIFVFAQIKIEKSKLQSIIKKSQVEKHNGGFTLPSDKAWQFNNSDSLYFKLDTIIAIVYKSSKHKSMCELVDWTFFRKNSFILGKESNCKEPPKHSASRYPEDYFTFAIYYVENETMIDILRHDKMIVESFKILSIDENSDATTIKLYRRFNNY